jgi:hypothetical protein
LIWAETDGWLSIKASAARVTLPHRTTARKMAKR